MNKIEGELDKTPDLQNRTILIIDDEPANLAIVTDYLAQSGFQIKVTQSGEAGLELARRTPPALILLDVQLPGVDGFETCRRLKEDERTRDIPVIFMTIVTRTEDKVRGFEVGGVDYITKPFQHEEVLARVTTHLRLRELTREVETARESLERRVAERTAELAQANVRLEGEITERKQAEQELALMNFSLNNVREAAFLIDGNARFHFVNDGACSALGYTRAELLRLGVQDIDPDFPPERWSNHWNELKMQRSQVFEGCHKAKDGRVFPVEINANYFEYDGQGYNLALARDITERKQAEEHLRQMHERLSLATRAARLGVWDWDIQKDELVWNDGMYELYGVKREDFAGAYEAWLKGIHPDDRAASDEISKQAQRGEREYDTEFRVVWPDGSIHYLKAYGQFVRDADGKPLRMTGVNFDITERKRAEEALRTTKILLEQTFEQSPVPMVLVTMPDLMLRYVNPAARRFLGIEDEPSTINTPLMELNISFRDFDLQGKEGFLEELPLMRSLKGIKTEGEERYIIRKDGTTRYELVSGAPIFDDTGQIIAGYLIMVDITERKQVENALRESERKYREIFDNVLDSLFLLKVTDDGHFRNLEVNPAFEKSTGLSRTQLIGKLIEETVPEEVASIVNAKYHRCVEAGLPIEEETVLDLPTGQRYFHSTLIPTRDENGHVSRIIGISRDITERKLAEGEIRRLNQELEQRVLDRTSQLEAANKELEAFAYSVSHDLRAPLRHIDGFIGMLQKRAATTLDDQSRHYMDVIADSARKMGALIDNLLSFSRMGRNEMTKARVDLSELVQEAIREFKDETEDRDIQWKIATLPIVSGDQAMLRIVMNNLIANALKFTRPRETAQIEIGCEKNNEGETVIFVRDNGVGFDMNYASKLFGVFQRLHHQDDFEGTGIGLANVHRIIARHGGRTWAEGEVDQGATFYFSLPLNSQERST